MKEPPPYHQIESNSFYADKKDNNRPFAIKLLALYVLILATWNGLRLVQGLIFWSILDEYKAKPGPMYIVVSGGIWFLIGLIISWGAWERKFWAGYAAVSSASFYGIWYWSDRLIFQRSHTNWPYALVATLVLITIPLTLLLSHGTRQSFSKDNYERKSQV
jgi:hypothetical protein